KSSLLQAAVFPKLVDKYDVRVIRVDAWPEMEEPTKWLANAMHTELGLREIEGDADARAAVFRAAQGAAKSSSRLLVIYLDQLEQLLYAARTNEETQPFFDCTEALLNMPLRNVRVVLSLREDYLGRFRDRLRDLSRITENGLRVGPMSVAELTEAVVCAAAAGEPVQDWSPDEMRGLMMQVRVPGQAATENAEAQSAYAQIICRALFQERAAGKNIDATEAEPILQRYFESTLAEFGELRGTAQALLEEHLVGADGSRTLRTEKELARIADGRDIGLILRQLENAAILRAEDHHGNRYFEIGHDWLARKVFEQRVERERFAEQKRIEQEQARQLALAKAQQRRLRGLVALSIGIAAVIGVAGVLAIIARSRAVVAQHKAEVAEAKALDAEKTAIWERDEANDLRVMAGYLALQSRGNSGDAMKLLSEVKKPEERSGWIEYANAALDKNALFVTLRGHSAALRPAVYSPDGNYVLTAADDSTARIWRADGTGQSIPLAAHRGPITSATFSPQSKAETLQVLTTSMDGTARIWTIRGKDATSLELPGKTAQVTMGAWTPDGQRVVVTPIAENSGPLQKEAYWVRLHNASDGSLVGEHSEHKDRVNAVVFLDNTHVLTASDDGNMRIWNGITKGPTLAVPGHRASVRFVAVNRERGLVVTASSDNTARVFKIGPNASLSPRATLQGHTREVLHAAISNDGKFILTASADRTARLWNIEKPLMKGAELILGNHDGAVNYVSFHPEKANIVATAAADRQARIFRVDAPEQPYQMLSGHNASVGSIVWSPKGDYLVTATSQISQSTAADHSARIWVASALDGHAPSVIEHPEGSRSVQVAAIAAKRNVFVAAYDDASVERFEPDRRTASIRIQAPPAEAWGIVSAVAVPGNGQRVAIASLGADGTSPKRLERLGQTGTPTRALHVYDNDKRIQQISVESAIRHVAWDNAGERVVAGLENGSALVVRIADSSAPLVLQGHKSWVTSAVFGVDGQTILTTSMDQTVLAFDAKGAVMGRFEHPAAVYAAALEPKGQRIATAAADGMLRVFDLVKKEKLVEFDAQIGPLHRITWSADGTRIAAGSPSGKIMVWSDRNMVFATEHRVSVLQAHGPILAVGFVDGSATLVAAAASRTYAWKLDVAPLQQDLRARNRDCLSVEHRTLYLNEAPSVAEKAFVECELRQGRGPTREPAPAADRASAITARLSVWPRTAQVEIEGVTEWPRDGFVEVWGRVGDKKKVRLLDGAFSTEIDVAIEASGANPAVLDLEDYRPVGGKKAKTLNDIDIEALVPEFKL
ncbi:MAG TPA: WD40 repeat domain-containing protein, partial [Polyangium sp.]|nr:WD40 repeat domain-containing protein [Polyangium sp.]